MIKRWILHVEFHWGYRPRISFRRAPKHGDRVLNGDEMGTLKLCPECQDGLLHEPDWRAQQKLAPEPSPQEWIVLNPDEQIYRINEKVWYQGHRYIVRAIAHDMDGSARAVHAQLESLVPYLRRPRVSDHQSPPAMDLNWPNTTSVMEFPIINGLTHDQAMAALTGVAGQSTEESPEKIRLEISDSPTDWKLYMEVFTRRSDYVVTEFDTNQIGRFMILTRKDVFEAQKASDPDNYYEQKRDW